MMRALAWLIGALGWHESAVVAPRTQSVPRAGVKPSGAAAAKRAARKRRNLRKQGRAA